MVYSYEPHHLEDLEEGKEFQSIGRTVTGADFMMYSVLSGDWIELHVNNEYTEDTQFGQRIVRGPMTFVQLTGFVYRSGTVGRTAIASLGVNYMDLPNPVFISDTFSQAMIVSERKNLGDCDDVGLVTLKIEMTKQDGMVVLEGDTKFLIETRSVAE